MGNVSDLEPDVGTASGWFRRREQIDPRPEPERRHKSDAIDGAIGHVSPSRSSPSLLILIPKGCALPPASPRVAAILAPGRWGMAGGCEPVSPLKRRHFNLQVRHRGDRKLLSR